MNGKAIDGRAHFAGEEGEPREVAIVLEGLKAVEVLFEIAVIVPHDVPKFVAHACIVLNGARTRESTSITGAYIRRRRRVLVSQLARVARRPDDRVSSPWSHTFVSSPHGMRRCLRVSPTTVVKIFREPNQTTTTKSTLTAT